MNENLPNENDFIGNEIQFPVAEKLADKPSRQKRKLFLLFLTGYAIILAVGFGIRCLFFIHADFTEGEVLQLHRTGKGSLPSIRAMILFKTKEGHAFHFEGAENLHLEPGEKVKVIYKKNFPQRAAVFSFFGFWFNTLLLCQVFLIFWVGILLAYYGYDYQQNTASLRDSS